MKKHLFISVLIIQLVSCNEVVQNNNSQLKIPENGFTFQIPQRSSIIIPSTEKQIKASINDITGGQTLLTLESDSTLFFSSAIHESDTLKFNYNQTSYQIICIDLVNNLIGEDLANMKIERLK